MIRGLYTSAIGMTTQFKKMDVISNNLANVDTTGFKKDMVVSQSFPEELTKRINDKKGYIPNNENMGRMSLGLYIDEVHTNYIQGSMKETDDPLNLAIQGDAFFAIETQDGIKYTRDGSFVLDPNGRLMTKEGNFVVGENGPITLETADVRIDDLGNIYVEDELVDTLMILEFENPETLKKVGDNLLEATEETIEKDVESTIKQGFLESSNVNVIREMVDMITATRVYEANQKAVQTHDETLSKAVNEVGKI